MKGRKWVDITLIFAGHFLWYKRMRIHSPGSGSHNVSTPRPRYVKKDSLLAAQNAPLGLRILIDNGILSQFGKMGG